MKVTLIRSVDTIDDKIEVVEEYATEAPPKMVYIVIDNTYTIGQTDAQILESLEYYKQRLGDSDTQVNDLYDRIHNLENHILDIYGIERHDHD